MKDKRNVRILNSINSVRLRPGMFIGDTSNCNHLIHEMLDNALDEIRNKYGNSIGVAFYKRGDIIIQDNGRGLPSGETIDENTGLKVDALESLFTKLHSGTKFSFESDQLESLFGQNGVGLVAVNALSEYVDIKSKDNHYKFVNSELCLKEKTQPDSFWSTEIKFKPSSEYFKSIYPDYTVFKNRLELAQAKLQNINIFINNKKLPKETMECFVRRQLKISSKTPLFYCEYSTKKMQVIEPGSKKIFNLPANIGVFLTYEPGETIILGDINLRFCEGTHLNSIINVIKSNILNKLDKKFAKTPERFLIEGIRLYVTAQIPFPQFDSQTKTRLVTDIKKDLIESGIDGKIIKILNEDYIKKTITSILNQKISNVNKIAKKKISSDNKLCDCLEHPGDVLYIIEGDSAAAPVRECRDAKVEAYLPLRGKVINVEKQSLAKIKENKEIKNIIEAVGQYPYRYNKIKVISDADCLSGDTLITYKDINDQIQQAEIAHIQFENIKSVFTYDFISNSYKESKVLDIINKESTKEFLEFTLYGNEKIKSYVDHGFPVYDVQKKQIIFLNANQINQDQHYFISLKKPIINNIQNNNTLNLDLRTEFLKHVNPLSTSILIKSVDPNDDRQRTSYKNRKNISLKNLKLIKNTDLVYQKNKLINLFPTINIDHAYLIGIYIGDGCFGSSKKNPYTTLISCNSNSKNINKIIDCCKRLNYSYVLDKKKDTKCTIIQIKSIEFYLILHTLGFNRNIKAESKFIPSIFFKVDKNIKIFLLKGLYSADGSFNQFNQTQKLVYTTTSKILKSNLIFILNSLNIFSRVIKTAPKIGGVNHKNIQIIGKKCKYEVICSQNLIDIWNICSEVTDLSYIHHNTVQNNNIIQINSDLIGIKIKKITNLGKLDRAYCLKVDQTHNFTINDQQILTFNCDGLHINVLVILIISKFFPEIIKEERLSIILPPLYGAYKNKSFIPLYSIDDVSKYKENGYAVQRFKGLGEMNSDQMRIIFNSNIEYIVKESKNIEETIKIILDSEIKRQYLNRDEYNFNTFIENVFKNIKSI